MHPLFQLITTRPHLLAEHAHAYAGLVSAELGAVSADMKRTAVCGVTALFCLGVAAVLGGMAVMLWAVLPSSQILAPWALWVVPLVPLAIAVGCLLAARTKTEHTRFDELRRQVRADIAMLREAEPV